MFDNFKQTAIAAVGAAILTFTAVAAAVGPARAIETAPVAYAQLNAEVQANG
jgi:energy-converting hydrogenase Eha subunit E